MTTETTMTTRSRSSRFDLLDRVVIVTGGAAGIGRVYAEQLADAGARVVVADIDSTRAGTVAESIATHGNSALGLGCDVADPASVAQAVERTVARFGRVDGLVNNAALMSALPRGPWQEIAVADWDRVMAVNLRGLFLCCQAVFPHMKAQGGGKIVNISSNRVFDGTPNRLHYSTSKAGVIGFTRSLAREVGSVNICVNAITPGYTASETQLESSSADYLRQMAALNERKALKRTQVPEDLVGAVLFLLSSASDFITGQTLNVDGGFVMH